MTVPDVVGPFTPKQEVLAFADEYEGMFICLSYWDVPKKIYYVRVHDANVVAEGESLDLWLPDNEHLKVPADRVYEIRLTKDCTCHIPRQVSR